MDFLLRNADKEVACYFSKQSAACDDSRSDVRINSPFVDSSNLRIASQAATPL
ncbi:MAG: hypothetical protein ACI915_004211 [Gammaproteobacteria bacterium]|jgi:hypothetical protein